MSFWSPLRSQVLMYRVNWNKRDQCLEKSSMSKVPRCPVQEGVLAGLINVFSKVKI
jgi:hypothetical protein